MSVWNDISSQTENLRSVIEQHASTSRPDMERAARLLKGAGRIIYTGVGSGLNATIPACTYLMSRGIPAQTLDTTEAAYDLFPGLQGSALVLNTRSGETVELVRLAEMARSAGIPTVAVTNEPGSTVGRLAEVCLPTHSRWDELVVLSAYGGMLATELILASYVSGEPQLMLEDLRSAVRGMQTAFNQALVNRQKASELFGAGSPVYLLGRGASLASAFAGALVLEEMSRQATVAMAGGLFRQGPIEVVDDRFRAIVFEGAGPPSLLNVSLARDLVSMGAGIYWIGRTQVPGALNLQLPKLPGPILPLLEVLPSQMLAFDLAHKKGFEPGSVQYIQKVITTETGLPNPTSNP
jgi:glucosamine--fructose-6-phosphate aminotransferase (isomerizing)